MRYLNFVLAVMFLLFAFLQVNDPDPVLWILIYGVLAVLCIMAMFSFYRRALLLGVLVALVAYSLVYVPGVLEWLRQPNRNELFDDVAKMEHVYIEEAREFIGLMICVAVVVFHLVQARRHAA